MFYPDLILTVPLDDSSTDPAACQKALISMFRLDQTSIKQKLEAMHFEVIEPAGDTLKGWLLPARILSLYAYYFPEEWASEKCDERVVLNGVSDAEAHFMTLVDKRLFSINDWQEERDWEIPYTYEGYEMERLSDGVEYFNPLIVAIMQMLNPELADEEEVHDYIMSTFGVLAPFVTVNLKLDWQMLVEECQKRGGVWANIPAMLEAVCGDTGTPWLDAREEMQNDGFEWSRHDMDQLIKMWADYKHYDASVNAVLAWVDQDRSTHGKEIFEFFARFIKERVRDETTQVYNRPAAARDAKIL